MKYILTLFILVLSFSTLAEKPLLVVTELAPPNQVLIDGTVQGQGTQYIRDIFKQAGLTPDIQMYPWARAYKMASEEKNTFIYSIARTAERENQFQWVGEIGRFEMGFVGLSDRTDIVINNTNQAKNYKIAMQYNDFSTQTLTKMGVEGVITSDIQHSYQLLLAKKVDLILDDPHYMLQYSDYFKLKPGHLKFIFKIDALTTVAYLAANKDTDTVLIEKMQTAYKEINKTKKSPYGK
ncbi:MULTISPECIES: transporter substrate-binding domain-containing protein [unclassified Pseudoalteromonas]|uniref:substrate-binding periplasmic protein n=1 Tax=unclassified Pseudoalteromonas TaxID=194690 RepID=UPI0007316FC1|nr:MULTISPECIES: transporter substrate-binding domain-containing protein [unclassified Pseudoalteromonas]KTD91938.1 amino acid ABC transporter substrate-binding protein [Pseudoalteromonas sp. H71]